MRSERGAVAGQRDTTVNNPQRTSRTRVQGPGKTPHNNVGLTRYLSKAGVMVQVRVLRLTALQHGAVRGRQPQPVCPLLRRHQQHDTTAVVVLVAFMLNGVCDGQRWVGLLSLHHELPWKTTVNGRIDTADCEHETSWVEKCVVRCGPGWDKAWATRTAYDCDDGAELKSPQHNTATAATGQCAAAAASGTIASNSIVWTMQSNSGLCRAGSCAPAESSRPSGTLVCTQLTTTTRFEALCTRHTCRNNVPSNTRMT